MNMDTFQKHNVKWQQQVTERYIQFYTFSMAIYVCKYIFKGSEEPISNSQQWFFGVTGKGCQWILGGWSKETLTLPVIH